MNNYSIKIEDRETITSLAGKLASGEVTSRELVAQSIARAKEVEPELNAFVSILDTEAMQQAEEFDKQRAKHGASGSANAANTAAVPSLSGIPVALKDNFNLIGSKTTASSKILENYTSPYNATVTQRMLDQGAIFMGKTNMDAFAHGSSTETSDFGPSKNPYDTDRVPGGSSGGSAVAVASGVCSYAIGSETAGSVRGPASWCGLYGFAPTFGRISRYGVVAMGSSLDRPGVLANNVMDCAILTDVISGQDKHDATSIPQPPTRYARQLSSSNRSLTIGLPKVFTDDRIDAEVRNRVQEVIRGYEKLGAKIVEIDLLDPKYSMAVYTIICRSEVSSNLARIDGIRYGYESARKSAEVLEQISYNRGEGFGIEAKQRSMTGAYALSAGYYDAYYKKAQQVRALIIADFKKAFESVDLIMGPTMPSVAPKLGVTAGNPLFGELADILTEPSALAGLPCLSVPAGENSEGLPIGFQIIGPQLQEQRVLNAGLIFEQELSR
jgi:aspartyl-tRNA(Asn)/glutamyl-tRNA(Gln) amidotransferase subunit A